MAASFTYYGRTDTSITIRVTPDSSYSYYKIFWRPSTTTVADTTPWMYKTSSFNYTITGLQPSTKYVINVGYAKTSNPSGADGFCGAQEWWTDDPAQPPSISSFTVTQTKFGSNTAKCEWSASNLNSASYVIEAASSTGQYWQKASGTAYSSGSATITLDNHGTYTVRITITNGDGQYATKYASVTMQSIEKWDWNKSNGRASAAQTRAAYNAITGNGDTTNFSYMVWNDLVDKVLSVRSAAGFPWNTRYASYSSTQMDSGDKTLYAWKFNSLRYNVYDLWSPVSSGDTVYGYYFTQITNQINNWIDNL